METIITLAIVALAAVWFGRWFLSASRGEGGCGCGCDKKCAGCDDDHGSDSTSALGHSKN